jgi:hypothetical protein
MTANSESCGGLQPHNMPNPLLAGFLLGQRLSDLLPDRNLWQCQRLWFAFLEPCGEMHTAAAVRQVHCTDGSRRFFPSRFGLLKEQPQSKSGQAATARRLSRCLGQYVPLY